MQFYETAVVAAFGPATYAVQALTSPAKPFADDSIEVDYEALLDDFDVLRPLSSLREITGALVVLADSQLPWERAFDWEHLGAFADRLEALTEIHEAREGVTFATDLINTPLIPAEASRLSKRSVAELSGLSAGAFLVAIGGVPMVVLIGGGIGIVVLRGAHAVSGALWEGARPEVVAFGADAAAAALDLLRNRLGIRRRSEIESRSAKPV